MVMIRIKHYVITAFLLLSLTVFLVLKSVSLQGGGSLNLSLNKQNVLYWGILVILFQIILLFFLILKHKGILRDIEKIGELKDLDEPQVRKILNGMGAAGLALHDLLKELNELLILRTYRIQSLNQVLQILCEDSPDAILVSDAMGSVLGQSNKMKEKLSSHPKGASDNIKDFFPAMNLAEVLNAMEKTRAPWDDREDTGLHCSPVFDRKGSLQLCLWEAEGKHFVQKMIGQPLPKRSKIKNGSFPSVFKKFSFRAGSRKEAQEP